MKKNLIYVMAILLLLVGCTAKTPWYTGYYFDAKINDNPIVKIEDKSVLRNLGRFYRSEDVHWMIKKKLSKELDVTVVNNEISHKFIGQVGQNKDLDIYLYPLDDQNINTVNKINQSKDTFVNGSAVNKTDRVMTSNTIPSGAYIIAIKTIGPENWDRKYVYVEYK